MAVKRDEQTPRIALPDTATFAGARWFAGKGRKVVGVELAGLLEPEGARGAVVAIAEVRYAEGGVERYALPLRDRSECAGDDPLWAALGRLAGVETIGGASRFLAEDLSNTVVALGDRKVLKLFRRLERGSHPEAEILGGLDGFPHVPKLAGTVEHDHSALVVVEEYVAGEPLGWEALITRLAAGDEALDDVRELARVTAALHRELAERLGTRAGGARDTEVIRRRSVEALPEVSRTQDLGSLLPVIHSRLRELDRIVGACLQRVHGDLHVGQVLRAQDARLVLVDFEGEPASPLAERAREQSPLVDIASLLLAFDHAGCAAARRSSAFEWRGWSARARYEALAAYETEAGPVDRELLGALEVAKELRELVYAARWLPEWLYAPTAVLPTLLEGTR
jgi:maltokinase